MSALLLPNPAFTDTLWMTLFISAADAACALRATLADLRAARRLFRPRLHVVRARANAGGRGHDLLALEGLLTWLHAATGGGLDAETAAELAQRAGTLREIEGLQVQP